MKTYEMVYTDWSSEVFFSDRMIRHTRWLVVTGVQTCALPIFAVRLRHLLPVPNVRDVDTGPDHVRSEERRVGKECYQPCRSRRSPYHEKKKERNVLPVPIGPAMRKPIGMTSRL